MSLVKALADFEGAEPGELSFKQDEVLQLMEADDSGWSKGVLNGVKGWFPSEFVVPVEAPPVVAPPEVQPSPATERKKKTSGRPAPAPPVVVAVQAAPVVAPKPVAVKAPSAAVAARTSERPVPAFGTPLPFPRVGAEQTLVSPRGTQLKTLKKQAKEDDESEDCLLNVFIGKDPQKQELYSQALSSGSTGTAASAKTYPSAVEVYEGYLDEMLKCLKIINQREINNLPAPTSAADALNATNAARLMEIFRNFILATGSQESSFGLSEALKAITWLANQLGLPPNVQLDKKASKKDIVYPPNTALEFLLSTLLQVLQARDNDPAASNPIASLNGATLSNVLTFCFSCLPFGIAASSRKLAAECLGALSAFHLEAVIDLFKERLLKCKSDDEFRLYSHFQQAIKHVKFSFGNTEAIAILQQYLVFIIQVEAKFSASSLRNALSDSLIAILQELKAPEELPLVADDQLRSQLGGSLYKIYEFALKKWIKKPKSRAAGFRLAMYMFLLFDPQRKDLNKKDITKIFLDQLKDHKQRLEGIESFSSFLRMLPADFAKPTNPGQKVFKLIITDAIPALFIKKTKDVTATEWKELTGLLSAMLQLDETLLTDPALVNVLKSSDYSIDSRCVVLRAFGGVVVSSPDADLGQSLQPAVTPIISQFCSSESQQQQQSHHHLSSLLVCFPALCIPESRRQIATSLIPGALSSDPELWTCSLQALQRFLLDEPEAHLQFILMEAFKYLKGQATSADALVHVRGISLLLSSYVNSRRSAHTGASPVPLPQAKAFCLCWLLNPDPIVVDEAAAMLSLIGKIQENDLFDILVNVTPLKDARPSKSNTRSSWIESLSDGLLSDNEFSALINDAWLLLSWNKSYASWYAKTLHVLTQGATTDHSHTAFDIVSQMIACLIDDDLAPPVRGGICSALELLHESTVESVARLALTVVGDFAKKKAPKSAPTLRGRAKTASGPQNATLEILMLRCYSILALKLSLATYEASTFLKSFLQERLTFWTSGQVDVATLDVSTNKVYLSRLIGASFLLGQAHTDPSASGSEQLMELVVTMVAATDANAPAVFHIAVGGAIREFFRFAPISVGRIASGWLPFAFQCAQDASDKVQDAIADGLSAVLERYPANVTEYVLDALHEDNFLLFLALSKSFTRRIAYWMTKVGAEIIFGVSCIKMCSPVSRARELAVSLANTLAKEDFSPGRELFYTDNRDLNMYVKQAVEYSAAIAANKPQLTSSVFSVFASLFPGLSDQQKSLVLTLLQPWTHHFGNQSPDEARKLLSAMLQISVASDPVFHRENVQRLYTSLTIDADKGQIGVVVDFLVQNYTDQPDHCVLCLASLMQTVGYEIVVALEAHLRLYPAIGSKSEVPTTAKSMDNFAEFDARASASFKMLEYISLEHSSSLLYRFLPSLLQSAFVYYHAPALVFNLAESLLRMDDIVPELKSAVENLKRNIDGIMARFESDSVTKEDIDVIEEAFGDICPGLLAMWSDIALCWGLGNTITLAANTSTRLWGYMLEEELTLEHVQQISFFSFACLYNGWLSKLYRMLDVLATSVVGVVPIKNADAKVLLTQLLCALSVSCAPAQVGAALAVLNSMPDAKQINAAVKGASGGSQGLYRATFLRPLFLESTRDAGVQFLRSSLKNGGSPDPYAAELALVVAAIYAQQTEAHRDETYQWLASCDKTFFDFLEIFGRKSFHLRAYDRRKFCSDFVQLILIKYPSGSIVDILLILLRNSCIPSLKAPSFRLMNALLELSPQGPSKAQFKLLQELATFHVYSSLGEVRLAAEEILLDLIIQYSPDCGVSSQLLTLVRVIPDNLRIQFDSDLLFPGDSEADYFSVLKRAEIAIATKCLNFLGATAAAVNLVRDQPIFSLVSTASEGAAPQHPVQVPEAIPVVRAATKVIDAASLRFSGALGSDGVSEQPKL